MDELMSRLKSEVRWMKRELDDLLDGVVTCTNVKVSKSERHDTICRLRGQIKGLERAQEMVREASRRVTGNNASPN